MKQSYQRRAQGDPYLCDATTLDWQVAGKPGLALRPVRFDAQQGLFLGMVGFEPLVRSGTHQHQAVACSYILDGALTDYQTEAVRGQVGINLKGATHDAIAYCRTLLVARLEGPVTYLPEDGPVSDLHAGAYASEFDNPDPAVPPDLMVDPDQLAWVDTGIAGVRRRMLFDYRGTGDDRRFVQLVLAPGASIPRLRAGGLTELWVQGGSIEIDRRLAWGNCFGILEPGMSCSVSSRFGARLLVWAQAPSQWVDRQGAELFGF